MHRHAAVGRSDRLAIANVAAHDRRMVEYGHGVGTATGVAGGGHGGGGSMDAGAAFGQFITDTVNNISALPPTSPGASRKMAPRSTRSEERGGLQAHS